MAHLKTQKSVTGSANKGSGQLASQVLVELSLNSTSAASQMATHLRPASCANSGGTSGQRATQRLVDGSAYSSRSGEQSATHRLRKLSP